MMLDEGLCEAYMVFTILASNTLVFFWVDYLEDIYQLFPKESILDFVPEVQCLAKVFGPLELCDLLPHFRLQT